MQNSGVAVQVLGVFTIVCGVFVGFVSLSTGGIYIVGASLVTGVLLICLGNAFYALGDLVRYAKQSADALDRIAKEQTGVASELPLDAAKRIRSLQNK